MDRASWWSRVSAGDRHLLSQNNGAAVPDALRARLIIAGASEESSEWWVVDEEDPSQISLVDEVVDWIEAAANGEVPEDQPA